MFSKALLLSARTRRPIVACSRRLTVNRADNDRLGRNLYRQLIRWCKNTDTIIPLSSFVPPVTLKPPHVDQESLELLSSAKPLDDDWQYVSSLLPANSKVQAHQMTVPIFNSEDAANLFRVVFRMNNVPEESADVFKQRISTAFEALKSLNQLTGGLQSLQQERERHLDRTGVLYHVGQVVQHKKERWRGVITGWEHRKQTETEDKLTSLTVKNYGKDEDESLPQKDESDNDGGDIQYTLILDSGDAHLLGGRRNIHDVSGEPVAMQSDLELVNDDGLVRIRSNWIPMQFDRFDASRCTFVPNDVKNYQFPLDCSSNNTDKCESADEQRRKELGFEIASGVQEFAVKLERRILDVTSCSESRGLGLLSRFQLRLSALAKGNVVPDSASLSARNVSQNDLTTYHLRHLLNLTLEISELLWIRQLSKDNKERIRFSIGDVVQHKKYGFRGVIVAWDPKAAVDVTHWDGLTDIQNPSELPFYHIVPDQEDCIEAFGGERPFRYVCEANLEECPRERSFIDVDLEPEWERASGEAKYDAPDEVSFKYAEDSIDDEVTEECLNDIMNEISRLQVAVRDSPTSPSNDLSHIATKLSLDNLFVVLQVEDTMDGALVLEETIKEIWKAHNNHELRSKLDRGIADLVRGNKERALAVFLEIIKQDPDYAEAWNKASTCYYMLGDMQLSLESAERTLELLPRHFQAMNGLGLVHYEIRRYKLAAQTFRQSLSLDPWSPVSSRLSACLDMLHGMDLEEELAPSSER